MFLKYNINGIAWAILIFILSSIPGNQFPDISFWTLVHFDKAAHIFFYAVLVILLTIGFIKQYAYNWLRYSAPVAALIIGIVYGGVLEVMQYALFIQRNGDVMDFVANSIGCFIGMLSFYILFGKNIVSRYRK